MTVQVVLSPDDEARLRVLAKERGVSPDDVVSRLVREAFERERRVDELFEAFDNSGAPGGASEAAFHRENWY